MYVKALHSDGTSSVYDVGPGPVNTGGGEWRETAPDAKTVLGLSDWKFSAEWVDPDEPTGDYGDGEVGARWRLRYARWVEDGLTHAVITGYPIYVLNENGKTIDRV
jgi:hypothetical protein